MKKKICYLFSDIDTSLQVDANIRFLDSERYDLTTIFLGPKEPGLYQTLQADGFAVEFILCRGKSDLPRNVIQLMGIFGRIKPEIIHTHLFHASMAGLTAARLIGIRHRVNTRHHSVEAHLYHPHAVYYDKYVNALSTHIVAITDLVSDVLTEQENVSPDKVTVVHHGFDLELFRQARESESDLSEKYGLTGDFPVVGVISRHIHWKGIQYTVPAFQRLLESYPKAKLVLANATGSFQPEVLKLLENIDPSRYCLIPFEREVLKLYKSFDVFVHVPIGRDFEAFGLVYVEAPAMRVPSVFTLSGIANDFIKDRQNALVVPFESSDAILSAMTEIVSDEMLRKNLVENGHRSIAAIFPIEGMMAKLDDVYQQVSG